MALSILLAATFLAVGWRASGASGARPDKKPPSVSVTWPSAGVSLFGTTTLAASASDDIGVTQVEWYVDGVEVAHDGDGAPWAATWDTRTVADGSHVIVAKAADAASSWGTSETVTFSVKNASAVDATWPTVVTTAPAAGATVVGTYTLAANATDNVAVTQVKWYVDGSEVAWDGGAPWSASWDSTRVADGTHQVFTKAADAAGNWGTSTVSSFTVKNTATTGDPVVVAAGDIACEPGYAAGPSTCRQQFTADLVKQINPSRVLMLGDAQYEYGTTDKLTRSYQLSWGAFKDKTLATAGGSHDFYGGGDFFTYFGLTAFPRGAYKPYSVDIGNWHIVSLNSFCSDPNVGGCDVGSSQYTWLKADLAATTRSCILAMWHEPYWTSGYRHDNETRTKPFLDLLYLFRADVFLSGHEHNYERLLPMRPDGTRDDANGITAFVVGTGGKSLEYGWGTIEPNSAARQRDTFGILKLTLHATSYDWEFVPEAGKTYTDGGTTSCH